MSWGYLGRREWGMAFFHLEHLTPGPGAAKRPGDRSESARLEEAVDGLRKRAPHFSSAAPLARWQRLALISVPLAVAALSAMPDAVVHTAAALAIAAPFAFIVLLRLAALWHLATKPRVAAAAPVLATSELPVYSVLVPLYKEAGVVPGLIAALRELDYPADRLEIMLIVEADDLATRRALQLAALTSNMGVVVVPPGLPRTKPRALNYALTEARGELVCVFDAEDTPAPDQLRRAAAALASPSRRDACVQARLEIDDACAGPLARQFALEYAMLFHGILPALERLGFALPLSGTSNHFRRDLLERIGAWDAYNVTEDADLGFRLARLGCRVCMLDSATTEEAPGSWRTWLGQRTRWLKGWIQTYLVHTREPSRLWRELGAWRFLGFHVTLGGMILSALVHPWFFALAALEYALGGGILPADGPVRWLCGFNLFAGYATGIALAVAAAVQLRDHRLLATVTYLPAYWLAISYAAYRAVADLVRRPYYWEKTSHRARNGAALGHVTE